MVIVSVTIKGSTGPFWAHEKAVLESYGILIFKRRENLFIRGSRY